MNVLAAAEEASVMKKSAFCDPFPLIFIFVILNQNHIFRKSMKKPTLFYFNKEMVIWLFLSQHAISTQAYSVPAD